MTSLELLRDLRALGASVEERNGEVVVHARRGLLTDDLKGVIRANRDGLRELVHLMAVGELFLEVLRDLVAEERVMLLGFPKLDKREAVLAQLIYEEHGVGSPPLVGYRSEAFVYLKPLEAFQAVRQRLLESGSGELPEATHVWRGLVAAGHVVPFGDDLSTTKAFGHSDVRVIRVTAAAFPSTTPTPPTASPDAAVLDALAIHRAQLPRRVGFAYAGDALAAISDDGHIHFKTCGRPMINLTNVTLLVGHGLTPVLRAFGRPYWHPLERLFDTQVAWKLLDGGVHLKDPAHFSLERALDQLGMQAPDVESAARSVLTLAEILEAALTEAGLEEAASIEMAVLPIVDVMTEAGVLIDRKKWTSVVAKWTTEAAALRMVVCSELQIDNIHNDMEVLNALQRKLGLPITHTCGDELAPYIGTPVIDALVRFRSRYGFISGVGKAVLRSLDASPDGRVRATFNQLGAATGRMSCKEPNLLGLPRDPAVRGCIGAPPGKVLIVADYAAIEMRVLADQTQDEALRRVFAEGRCPHKHTASVLTGTREDQVGAELKQMAKPLNFGLSFGMGDAALIAYALKNFRVKLTAGEAAAFRRRFFSHYQGINTWQKRTASMMAPVLHTASGRSACYFDDEDDYNARLAFPIQGTAADGLKVAMILLAPRLGRFCARIILAVHDELVVEVPADVKDEVRDVVEATMIEAMSAYVRSVPIKVKVAVRTTWAE